mgnify:CR=1 FL=1
MPRTSGSTYGEKMIEVSVRFWTNDIASEKGQLVPKHAWDSGMVAVPRNKTHGLGGVEPMAFTSILELTKVIADALAKQGVTLHMGRKSRRLMKDPPQKSKP